MTQIENKMDADEIIIKDYSWVVTDGVAKPINPHPYNYGDGLYPSCEWDEFNKFSDEYSYNVLLEDGTYTGDQFAEFCDSDTLYKP